MCMWCIVWCMYVCVCVCACARARVCVYVINQTDVLGGGGGGGNQTPVLGGWVEYIRRLSEGFV